VLYRQTKDIGKIEYAEPFTTNYTLDMEIEIEEVKTAFKTMKTNKAPGLDGISSVF